MQELLARRRRWVETFGWGLSVIGALSFGHFLWMSIIRDGGAAYDLHAYLSAGRTLLEGGLLYPPMEINDPGAYRYPPTFAFLAVPFAPIPEPVMTWGYRAACLGCLRILVGSWRAVGWSFLFIPVQIELIALNVTLPIAAVARLALRGPGMRFAAGAIPATAGLKFGTAVLLPYLWITRPSLRRPILVGLGTFATALAVHALLDPAIWGAYLASLRQQAGSVNDAPFVGDQLLFLVPSTLGDFVLRLGLGVALTAVAVRFRADSLAFTAAALAVPTLWVARFAALAGVPRLLLEDLRSRAGSAAWRRCSGGRPSSRYTGRAPRSTARDRSRSP